MSYVLKNFIRVVFYFENLGLSTASNTLVSEDEIETKVITANEDNVLKSLDNLEKTKVKTIVDTKVDTKEKKSLEAKAQVAENSAEKIILYMMDNPFITRGTLVELLGMSLYGVYWNIRKLKNIGRIKRVVGDKTGYWEVILGKENKDF